MTARSFWRWRLVSCWRAGSMASNWSEDGGALRVLVVIPALDGDEERRKAEKGRLTARLAQAGVRVDFLDERGGRSSLAAIQRELRRSRSAGDPYHVLHLACTLEDDDTQLPYLILENEQGDRQRAVVDQLKWCAAEHRLKLVVFGGLAPAKPPAVATTLPAAAELAQVCAEAVIVPRFPMDDDAGISSPPNSTWPWQMAMRSTMPSSRRGVR